MKSAIVLAFISILLGSFLVGGIIALGKGLLFIGGIMLFILFVNFAADHA